MKLSNFWKQHEKDIVLHGKKMNIVESCVDRHAENPETSKKLAFVFQDKRGKTKKYTYKELYEQVNKFANYFKKLKIKENSHVALFLPKIPELYISFLAIIKSGSIAVPLFEAFQKQGLELRLKRGDIDFIITNKELLKRLKNLKIKNLKKIIVDFPDFKKKFKNQKTEFKAILKNRKSPCLMIFTSSTAGTPVAGILLSHEALIQQHYTAKLVLKLNEKEKYWCTAHPGWVTGSVYGIIAPLSIGCTNFIYKEHFDVKKWISFLKNNKISIVYTAPTAFRMLKEKIKKSDFQYVKNICSVGEALTLPIYDFYKNLGIVIKDTYWQTETGAIVIANLEGRRKALGKAIPGITVKIVNKDISLKPDFPSLMTGIYKHEKMYKNYFKKTWFVTNDLARKDKQGYFFFEARKDDIIKTSGERVSPLEIESVLEKHKAVKETAVIGIPHEVKGSIIKAFVVLNKGFEASEKLKQELSLFVKQNYAGHSYPKEISFIKNLPKTNSGKIIRMKLRKPETR